MGSKRGDTDRSTQCPHPYFPCAFPRSWFLIEPALTRLHPFPHLSSCRGLNQCKAPAGQLNKPDLSPPEQWHLGALPSNGKWLTPKRRLARKARRLVTKQMQKSQEGEELQVTKKTRPRCPEDFRSSHLHTNAQNPCKPVHNNTQRNARGSPLPRVQSLQALLPRPTKEKAAKPLCTSPSRSRPGARIYLSASKYRCAPRCGAAPALPATRCCPRGGSRRAGCARRKR